MFRRKKSYGETGVDVTTDARVLFDAVRHGKNHLVRFILEASSVDIVNSRDLHGKTPLMASCYTKEEGARDNIVRLLLRHGADVNLTDDCGRTALSYVCERRCNDLLRILIKEHNIDPDIADTNGNTPLIYSAMVGNDIACDILIRHFRRLGLCVDAINDEGFTALLMASKHGNITCAQILLGQGKASLKHRDVKYGLSVEEWLSKKGFSLQDIAPIRHDGKGRSRFVKLANIAAICSGPKKGLPQSALYGDIDFNLNNFQQFSNKYEDDDQYVTDGTASTDISIPRYFSRYHDIDIDLTPRHYRVYPYQHVRPVLKTQGTQTDSDVDCDESRVIMPTMDRSNRNIPFDQATEITAISAADTTPFDPRTKSEVSRISPERKKSSRVMEKLPDNRNPTSPSTKLSLPDIDEKPMVSRSDSRNDSAQGKKDGRKKSLDVLPEKLIANIELGDGRRHSIQLHTDSAKNKVYWTPVSNEDDSDECGDKMDKKNLLPRQFDKKRMSISDSDVSTNDDAPIFS